MRNYLSFFILQCTLLGASVVSAEEFPLWQLDLGLGAIRIDAYPGVDYSENIVVPIPNFQLNSPYLQAGRGGAKMKFLNSEVLDIGMDVSGSIPTKSEDIEARRIRSMPDLDPTLEIGLTLKYNPIRNDTWDIYLKTPVRKATGIDLKSQRGIDAAKIERLLDLGWTFTPRWTIIRHFNTSEVERAIDLEIGAKYASEQNMEFFYGVRPEFTLPGDQPYEARAGLMSTQVQLGYVQKRGKWRTSISATYRDVHDAENVDSPLVGIKNNVTGFLIVTYTFAQSELMVEHDEDVMR